MAKIFDGQWKKAKEKFEKDAGKVIAKQQGKEDANAKLKKPSQKGWFGVRKSSGMESACKALDTAAAADANEKDRRKALDAYKTAADNYNKELLEAAKTVPYKFVTKEIQTLRDDMYKIAADFRRQYADQKAAPVSLDKAFEKRVLLLKVLASDLKASIQVMAKKLKEIDPAGLILQTKPEMDRWLKGDLPGTLTTLRDITKKIVPVFEEFGFEGVNKELAGDINDLLKKLPKGKFEEINGADKRTVKSALGHAQEVGKELEKIVRRCKVTHSECVDCLALTRLV
ncbi:MAG: hypothetical protein DWH79_10660 [Planctomycetota bacterium]|nr:MAG: hypothetical protein DWH79_10660 [Planctomycetota bacterium]